jgi:lipopolysaccharide export system protein LptA
LRSKTLDVFYDQDDAAKGGMKAAQPGPGGKQSIRRLEAKGGVTVTQKEQTATGQTGIFDMKSNTITMTGGVVISQGKNVLKGDRLIVDVATGHARMEAGQGRVSGMFSPSSRDDGKKPDKKPDAPAAGAKKPAKTGTKGGAPARP